MNLEQPFRSTLPGCDLRRGRDNRFDNAVLNRDHVENARKEQVADVDESPLHAVSA